MTTSHEYGAGNEQQPDLQVQMVEYLEATQHAIQQYSSFNALRSNDFAKPLMDDIDDAFTSELFWGIQSINQILINIGGIPLEFVDDVDGEPISGKLIACGGFNADTGLWNVRVAKSDANMYGEFHFSTDEIRESYQRASSSF